MSLRELLARELPTAHSMKSATLCGLGFCPPIRVSLVEQSKFNKILFYIYLAVNSTPSAAYLCN